jgi:flagellar basal-body rod protein FlgC
MDLYKSMVISAAGMRAQSVRMRVISENLANADSTAAEPGGDPYRRKTISFKNHIDREVGVDLVEVNKIGLDPSKFGRKYDPGHPAADADGYVSTPNVNGLVELMDMRQAQRTYQANVSSVEAAKAMMMRTIDLLRS